MLSFFLNKSSFESLCAEQIQVHSVGPDTLKISFL